MAKEVKLKKIPLHLFIETLISIYERGAEYIDIIGVPDKEQDSLMIAVTEEYLTEDSDLSQEKNDKIIIPKPKTNDGLTEDDFSSLT